MRKITEESTNAFYNKGTLKKQNMDVFFDSYDYKSRMLLHDNCIATFDHQENILTINSCGWFTVTTKERLNALKGVNIQQKAFKWYLNGIEWNGNLLYANSLKNLLTIDFFMIILLKKCLFCWFSG